MNGEQLVDVSQIVGALVLAFHFPGLFVLALHCQLHGLQAIATVDVVGGFHELGALGAPAYRVEQVGLYVCGWHNVAYHHACFLVRYAWAEKGVQQMQSRLGQFHGVGCGHQQGGGGGIGILG